MGHLCGSLELNARVLECILDDLARLGGFSTTLDKQYVRLRIANEGSSFLTKALPMLGRAFDEWMKDESKPLEFRGFKREFLSSLRRTILESSVDHDRAFAISAVRQLAYLYYKVESTPTEEQLASAISSFVEVDNDLMVQDLPWMDPRFELARRLIADLIGRDKFENFKEILNPRHGPGAVATGERGIDKWHFKRLNPLIGQIVDFREIFHFPPFSTISSEETSEWEKNLVIDPFPTSKLVAVPKDSRGPRLICEEPLEIQYLQQWVFQIFDQMIECSRYQPELSIRDQSRNQVLAAEGSITSAWSTLDLKEASDRVSLALVLALFPSWVEPWFRALRSVRVDLPNGKTIPTVKFAPMGSALCFPVESIIFWALSRATCVLNGHSNRLPCPTVSVFGDDIIIPNDDFEAVCDILSLCGLVVNRAKSYHTGSFRESCGYDAYNGYNVTPVRIKKEFPSSWTQGSELSNHVAVINGFHDRCYYLTAEFLRSELLKVAPLLSADNVSGLCMKNGPRGRVRYNHRLQRSEVYTYSICPIKEPLIEGSLRMRRSLISPVAIGDPTTLQYPRKTRVEKGWVARLIA